MIKIVILGLLFSDESLECAYKYSKAGVQMAPHMFQKRMIQGIKSVSGVEAKVINITPVGSYPVNYRKLLIKNRNWQKDNFEIGYLNLPIIKHLKQERKLYSVLEHQVRGGEMLHILIYSLYEPFLKAATKLKKKYTNVKVCLLQTDAVPGIGDQEKYMTSGRIKKGKGLIELARNVDSFVVLTKYLADALETGERPYSVVECICDPSQPGLRKNKSENICLYTGTTMAEYNIKDVVDAFKHIENAQLWICGFGSCDEYIRGLSNEYPNIKHFGMLKPTEVQKLRDQCDFLINPRRPTGTYTKYSFPSKTAEYLMSGKPAILYKLEGIPDEYDQYVNYLKESSPERLAKELKNIFSADYSTLARKAERARIFMVEEKNPNKQGKKIVQTLML